MRVRAVTARPPSAVGGDSGALADVGKLERTCQLLCVLAVGMLSWGGITVLLVWQGRGSAGVC